MTLDIDAVARLAWAQLWQVTVAIGAVAVFVRIVGKRRPHLTYGLWMLVVLKCLTPPLWSSPTGVFSWLQPRVVVNRADIRVPSTAETPSLAKSEVRQPARRVHRVTDDQPKSLSPRGPSTLRPATVLLGLWIAGMAVCAGVAAMIQRTCSRALHASGLAVEAGLAEAVANLARRLGLRRRVRVLVTTRPLGPAVFGVIRPTLVLPAPLLSALSSEQLEPILTHELIHIRRGDIAAGYLQVIAQVLWWFHPLVWWANRAASRDRESCCDEESLAALKYEPGRYARGLLSVLELRRQLRPIFALPGVRPLDVTRKRLEHIMTSGFAPRDRTSRRQWLVLAALAVILAPGAGLPARSVRLGTLDQPQATNPANGVASTSETAAKLGESSHDEPGTDDPAKGTPTMKDELANLQGSWAIASLEMDGANMPGGGARIIVAGETFKTTGMGATYEGTLSLDPSKTPKTIDMKFAKGPEQGNTNLAIYEIEGDTWKLCIDMTGKDRPKEFSTARGSGRALEILKREVTAEPVEPSKTKATPPESQTKADPEMEVLAGEWSCVSLTVDGQALPEPFVKTWLRTVKGNEVTVTNGGQVVVKATFIINATKKPKTIDYTLTQGPDSGKMQLGIYELDGDTIKYCMGATGKDRPKAFESKAGDGIIFGVWKKPKK
jgi:uncharacterized protein (TIGR03067 family)